MFAKCKPIPIGAKKRTEFKPFKPKTERTKMSIPPPPTEIPASDEKELILDEAVKLIMKASCQLKCGVRSRCKALFICHQFKRCILQLKSDFYKNIDSNLLAAACISLSVKSNGEKIEFDAILMTFFYIVKFTVVSIVSEEFQKMRISLTQMEFIVLRMIDFSLNHRLAHDYLVYFLFDINQELAKMNIWDVVNENGMKIVSDFYLSNKCLDYNPEEIASSAIEVALYMSGADVQKSNYFKTWIKHIKESPKKLDIFQDIFKISVVGPEVQAKVRRKQGQEN